MNKPSIKKPVKPGSGKIKKGAWSNAGNIKDSNKINSFFKKIESLFNEYRESGPSSFNARKQSKIDYKSKSFGGKAVFLEKHLVVFNNGQLSKAVSTYLKKAKENPSIKPLKIVKATQINPFQYEFLETRVEGLGFITQTKYVPDKNGSYSVSTRAVFKT
jgi:hypothetical protein